MEFSEEQELQEEVLGNHHHSRQTKKENSEESHRQQDSDYLDPVYQAKQEKIGFSSQKNIVDALYHLMKEQSAPDIELDRF